MTSKLRGEEPSQSVIPSCPHYSTARPDLSSRAARFLFSRHKRRIAWNPLIRPPMVGALANGKAGLADFPRLRGKHIHARDGTSRVSAEHRPADRFPRAHNPSSRSCNRPNATFRRPAIHEPIIHTNISPRQRGTPPRGTARPAPSHENRRRAPKSASFSAGRGKLTVSRREGGLFDGLDRMCRLREAHRGALRRPLRRVRRAALPRL